MDIVVALLIFIGVIVVAAVVFGGWVVVAFVRLIGRALGGSSGGQTALPAPRRTRCAYDNCRADNDRAARFCRRCGRPVEARQAPVVRRVAMW